MPTSDVDVLLEPQECLRLLRSVSIGRVVYTESALPAVRPVTFAAPDGEVVIPAGKGSWGPKLDGTVVAFEAGDIDAGTRSGWSVVAVGRARLVTDPSTLPGFGTTGRPWGPETERLLLAIDIEHITGRRTRLAPHHAEPVTVAEVVRDGGGDGAASVSRIVPSPPSAASPVPGT
jgi:hypothetical protein